MQGRALLEAGAAISGIANKGMYYKVEQFFLQIWGTITKGGTFYYKVGQLLQSTAVQEF